MRRILVMSDSHGNNYNVQKAVKKAGKIDLAFHLGDVGTEYLNIERATHVPTYIVRGNNDYSPELREMIITYIGTHKVLCVHGHRHGVHFGLDSLRYLALQNECEIVMFGHTHVPVLDEGDVTFINPGSLTYPRQIGHKKTFLIIEVDDEDKLSYRFDSIDEE